MLDNATPHQNRLRGNPHLAGKLAGNGTRPPEGGEGACPAFGYLRSLHEHASAVEFRLKGGISMWFPYNWLGTWKFDPSAGLLLKFSGDLVYLVLIRGSNLDKSVEDSGIDLIRAGLRRHCVLWVREMGERTAARPEIAARPSTPSKSANSSRTGRSRNGSAQMHRNSFSRIALGSSISLAAVDVECQLWCCWSRRTTGNHSSRPVMDWSSHLLVRRRRRPIGYGIREEHPSSVRRLRR